jgi:sulfur-oxidizing protein SoxY
MELTRRHICLTAGAAAGLAAIGAPALAASDDAHAAIMAFTGGVAPEPGGVDLDAPEIAENGASVPVDVRAEGASAILLIATANPHPDVATFHFGPLAGASHAATRIRLGGTQDVIAVAKMADGSFRQGVKNVKVTIGGCGG